MSLTCQHKVAVGAWCRYCGTAVDADLVAALAFNPAPQRHTDRVLQVVPQRDPDIELFDDGGDVVVGECPECHTGVLVSSRGWKKCKCGTQSTVLRCK